jgi:microsomal epoxide hydrolase
MRQGGHFAALERPQVLADDIVEFLEQVWPRS